MPGSMSGALCFVYIIRSRRDPSRFYTGVSADVDARLAAHNAGRSPHTSSIQAVGASRVNGVLRRASRDRIREVPEVGVRRRVRAEALALARLPRAQLVATLITRDVQLSRSQRLRGATDPARRVVTTNPARGAAGQVGAALPNHCAVLDYRVRRDSSAPRLCSGLCSIPVSVS